MLLKLLNNYKQNFKKKTMSENYRIGMSGRPVVFTRQEPLRNVNQDAVSPRQIAKMARKVDIAVIEVNGEIRIKQGICATAIILKARNEEYQNILHWPVIEDGKMVRKNGYDPDLIVVLSDSYRNRSLKKGDDVEGIITGEIPEGFEVEFIPPKLMKKFK